MLLHTVEPHASSPPRPCPQIYPGIGSRRGVANPAAMQRARARRGDSQPVSAGHSGTTSPDIREPLGEARRVVGSHFELPTLGEEGERRPRWAQDERALSPSLCTLSERSVAADEPSGSEPQTPQHESARTSPGDEPSPPYMSPPPAATSVREAGPDSWPNSADRPGSAEARLYRSVDSVRRPSEPPSADRSRATSVEPGAWGTPAGGNTPLDGGSPTLQCMAPHSTPQSQQHKGTASRIDLLLGTSSSAPMLGCGGPPKPLLMQATVASRRHGVTPSNPATKGRAANFGAGALSGSGSTDDPSLLTSTMRRVEDDQLDDDGGDDDDDDEDGGFLSPRATAFNWMAAQLDNQDNESVCSNKSGRSGITHAMRGTMREQEQAAAAANADVQLQSWRRKGFDMNVGGGAPAAGAPHGAEPGRQQHS